MNKYLVISDVNNPPDIMTILCNALSVTDFVFHLIGWLANQSRTLQLIVKNDILINMYIILSYNGKS